MYSEESTPEAPERMDTFLDNSQTNWEQNFLDISVKDEPLDITDYNVNDVKSESENDACVPMEPEVKEDIPKLNNREIIPADASSMIEKTNAISNILDVSNQNSNNISRGEVPVTRKVIINGQAKTCILVNNPGLKQSIMDNVEKARKSAIIPTSPDKSSLNQDVPNPMVKCCRCTSEVHINNFRQHIEACPMVKCSRCGSEVHIDDFRQHIDACPPRKPNKISRINAASKAGQNQTVQAMYNPSTGEVVSLNDNPTKAIVHMPKNVGKISESNFANSKEVHTSSQNSFSINDSCFTNVRSQSNNLPTTGSDISLTLHNKSCSGAASTNVMTIWKSATRDTLLVTNSCTLTTDFNKTSNLIGKNQLNPPQPQQHLKDRDTNCVILNGQGVGDDISFIRTECEKRSCEQISEDTLLINVLDDLKDTIDPGCANILSSINDKPTSELEECNQQVSRTRRKSVTATLIGSPRVRTRSKSFGGGNDANASKCSGNEQVIEPLSRTRSKSVCARKCAEIITKAADSLSRSVTTTSKCSSTNKDKNPTNLSDECSVRQTRSHPACREKFVINLTRGQSVPRDYRKSVNVQEDQLIGYLEVNGSSKNSHDAESRNRNESAGEENYNNVNSTLHCHSKNNTICQNLGDNGTKLSEASVTSTSGICNPSGYSNIEYVNVTDIDEYSPASNLLLLQNNTFSCSVCSFTTDKKRTLTDHERNHRKTNLPIFCCFYCNQRYTRYSLYLHIQDVHPGQKFQIRDEPNKAKSSASRKCSSCSFSTNNRAEFLVHTANHSLETDKRADKCSGSIEVNVPTSLSCSICSFSASDQKQLSVHLANHSFKPVTRIDASGLTMFCCEYCSYQNSKACKVSYHLNSHKNNRRIKKCPTCEFKSTPQALFCHMQKCPSKSKSGIKLPKRKRSENCSKRSFSTTERGKLNLHKKERGLNLEPIRRILKSGRPFFSCGMCSYGTSNSSAMRCHVKAHKNNPPITNCQNCKFKSTAAVLKYHVRKCNGILKSDVSDSKGVSESKEVQNDPLSLNVRTKPVMLFESRPQAPLSKSGSKLPKPKRVYKCSTCPFSTNAQMTLKLHKKEHRLKLTPIKRILEPNRQFFNCGMCSYGTANSSDMRGHIKAHKNNPPIINCQNCNFKSTAAALKHHVRKCNGNLKSAIASDSKGASEPKEVKNDPPNLNDRGKPITVLKSPLESTPQAQFCHIEFPSKSKSGTKSLKPKRAYKCSKCPFSTTEQVKLKLHKKGHGLKLEPITRILKSGRPFFSCRMCSYGTSHSSDMRGHVKTHRSNPQILNCQNCNFKSTAAVLRFHERKCKEASKSAIVSDSKGVPEPKEVENDPPSLNVRTKPIMHSKSTPQAHHLMLAPIKRTLESGLTVLKCGMCSYETSSSSDMRGHVKTHENNPQILSCQNCNFKSTSAVLKYHVRKCNEIIKPASDSKGVSESKAVKSDPSNVRTEPIMLFQCNKCSFFTSLRIKLKLHIRKRHLKSINVKNNPSSTLAPVERHRKTSLAAENINGIKCSYCSFVAKNKGHLWQHMRGHKSHIRMEQCSRCSFKSTPNALKNHLLESGHNTNHAIVTQNAKKKNYQCLTCSFIAENQYAYSNHMKVHKGNKAFKCRFCSLACSTISSLKSHMKSHRRNRKMETCPDCNFRSTPRPMRNHICGSQSGKSIHSDNINTKYSTIEEKLTTGVTNENIGTDRTPNVDTEKALFNCSLCPFSTSLRIKLNFHLIKHHQLTLTKHFTKIDNRYQCSYCSYIHIRKEYLIMHTDTHLKWKMPLEKCKYCDYTSTSPAIGSHLLHCRKTLTKTNTMTSSKSNKGKTNTEVVCSSVTAKIINVNKAKQKCLSNRNKSGRSVVKSDLGSKLKRRHVPTCHLCSYSSNDRRTMAEHILAHETKPILQCMNCSYRATPRALSIHMTKCHAPKDKQMIKNNKVSKIQSNKTKNKREEAAAVTSPKVFNCSSCSFTSFWLYVMDRHIKSHTILKLPIKQCGKCDFRSTPFALSAHTKACSGKTGANGSPPKNLELSKSDSEKNTNDLKVCDTARIAKPINRIKCVKGDSCKMFCGRTAIANNTGITNYTLGVSETESSNKDKNNAHSPPKALFSCPNCSFTTNLRIKLKFHVQKKHSEPETVNVEPPNKNVIPCKYCSYTSRNKFNVLRHEQTHINKAPIRKCSKCSFRSTRDVLRIHELKCNALIQA